MNIYTQIELTRFANMRILWAEYPGGKFPT
jgi:hypothetical protein